MWISTTVMPVLKVGFTSEMPFPYNGFKFKMLNPKNRFQNCKPFPRLGLKILNAPPITRF